jgi:hypothetical protein
MAKTTDPAALAELKSLLQETAKSAPPRSATAYDTVKGLYPDIRELKAKRFTDREIVDMLASKGFDISLGTFRQYVQRATRELGDEPQRTKRKQTRIKKAETESTKLTTEADGDANAKPKPSELAISSRPKAGAGAKATGHRLSDDDL